ncbi:MAG: UDP-N-acetylmuramoyl-L-alanine--D-glutamate ligase [Bacteroidetes bacterium 4572_77]|nr:MAG: UDP-N-acetylmuramoyl-L-alanine--D-glutamate ligase [Bacteroidetes bacterium 4572_77]
MKKLVVLGAGESGTGAAILGFQKGYQVLVSDNGSIKEKYKKVLSNNEIKYEEQGHSHAWILKADLVVKSPGIPNHIPLIKKLKEKGIPVISEIEFAARYTQAKLLCITGSNGKTTTASLLYHLLKQDKSHVILAGNIGESFAWAVAKYPDTKIFVLELSSFQLDDMYQFRANTAVILNITPDHLDRYENDFQKYVDSKFRILQNMTSSDYFIYNADDVVITTELAKRDIKPKMLPFSILKKIAGEGAWLQEDNIIIKTQNNDLIMSLKSLALQGKHNTYNTMAAGIPSKLERVRNASMKESLKEFQSLEHRMEQVATIGGVQYINDSKATNINSVFFALDTLNKNIIWIAGGKDKGNDYGVIKSLVQEKVKAIICLGLNNTSIIEAFKKDVPNIRETYSASEAVEAAQKLANAGDVVLLSPACASFDLFDNYQDRGDQFKNAVNEL